MSDQSFSSNTDMMFEGHFVMVLPWFRLFSIQGENVHSVQKQIENISEHKSKEWLPHSMLWPITGSPRLSFCLSWHFFFSCLRLDWVRKKTTNHPQNPQQRMRALETDNLKRCEILQERGAPNFIVGEAAWGDLQGSHRGLSEYVSGSAWPFVGGATLLSFQSLASSQLGE